LRLRAANSITAAVRREYLFYRLSSVVFIITSRLDIEARAHGRAQG
jgi:hypothetical protein